MKGIDQCNYNTHYEDVGNVVTPENIRQKSLHLKRELKKECIRANLFEKKKPMIALAIFPLYLRKLCNLHMY